MDEILKELLDSKRVFDMYRLSRYMYRIGKPAVTDEFYERLNKFCVEHKHLMPGVEEYLERTYDDDPIPLELLQEFGLEDNIPKDLEARNEYYSYLDEEKSLSIEAVTEYADAYTFCMNVLDQDLIMTPKVNGINVKSLILNEDPDSNVSEFKLALSRGRRGRGFDFTDKMLKLVPRFYKDLPREVKVYSESYVESDALDYLKERYDADSYKTEKSSAISMLRVEHKAEDYKYLHTLAFAAEGLATTLSRTLDRLSEMGFETVKYIKIPKGEIPVSYEEFVPWLKEKFDLMLALSEGIPTDGIVLAVDDLTYDDTVRGQYSNRNIALKMEYWSFDYYYAEIEDIIIEQQRVEASCRLKIKPLLAKDRTEARVLNAFNPDIIIEEGYKPGSIVMFERNSGAINSIVRGERRKNLSK